MIIRQEAQADYEAVYRVVLEAFLAAEHTDGTEQDLVAALRRSEAFVPELSLVADEGGVVVGHVLLTQARVGKSSVPTLALAPLSVLPAFQRQGIGAALVREGHRIAGSLGYAWSIVLGDARYYTRFGYAPALDFGIEAPFEVPSENFMACRLREDAPAVSGMVNYAPEFGIA